MREEYTLLVLKSSKTGTHLMKTSMYEKNKDKYSMYRLANDEEVVEYVKKNKNRVPKSWLSLLITKNLEAVATEKVEDPKPKQKKVKQEKAPADDK